MYKIGIDLGGTNIATAVVNEDYKIIGKASVKTALPRSAKEIAADMAKTARMACDDAGISLDDVDSIGIGSPGAVDPATNNIVFAGNLGFENVPLGKYVEEFTGKKCFVENDANAAAYGELIAGAGKGTKDFVAVTLGTGVGSGIILDGKIFSGSNNFGAEVGHICIQAHNGEPCTCGRHGCWETYASATALINQTRKAMENDKSSKMWEIAGSLEKVSGKTAFDAMRAGDIAGTKVCEQYIEYVACGIANIINIFQPQLICIGGGICKEGDVLLNPIKEYVSKNTFASDAINKTEIKIAQLGNDAGIIGAAFLGLQNK